MNTVVKEIVLTLTNNYKVESIYGGQYSFKGYYENKTMKLDPEMVETVHHKGGCFLGLSKT